MSLASLRHVDTVARFAGAHKPCLVGVCSPRLRPRVHVHPVDPERPAAASRAALGPCAQTIPRARPVVVVSLVWGRSPGLGAAPWTIDGARQALGDRGWSDSSIHHARLDPVGHCAGPGRHPGAATGAGLWQDEHTVRLAMPGVRRPLEVPRLWIGASLCLVVPMVHMLARGDDRLVGPCSGALASVATWCGSTGHDARVGECLVQEVFAAVVVLIDGAWWAALSREGAPVEIAALGRCLASSALGDPGGAAALDDWIATKLGLLRSPRRSGRAPVAVGPDRASWPRVSVQRLDRDLGLKRRAVDALWRPDDGSRSRRGSARGLMPPAPGPLARTWDTYTERHTRPS